MKSSPQLIVLLLSLLGLAIVAFRIFGPVDQEIEEVLEGYGQATNPAVLWLLPLEPLRIRLSEVDQAMADVQVKTKDDLEFLAEDIALSVTTLRITVDEIAPASLSRAASALTALEESIEPLTFDSDSLAELRSGFSSWRRLYVAVDPNSPASASAQPTNVAGLVSYRVATTELISILTAAAESGEALTSDPPFDLAFEWRESANELLEKIYALQASLPTGPRSDSRPRVVLGFQHLDGGFAKSRELLLSDDIPDSFDSALELANDADTAFTEVLEDT